MSKSNRKGASSAELVAVICGHLRQWHDIKVFKTDIFAFFMYHSFTPETKILRANVKLTFALEQNFLPLCPLP